MRALARWRVGARAVGAVARRGGGGGQGRRFTKQKPFPRFAFVVHADYTCLFSMSRCLFPCILYKK